MTALDVVKHARAAMARGDEAAAGRLLVVALMADEVERRLRRGRGR